VIAYGLHIDTRVEISTLSKIRLVEESNMVPHVAMSLMSSIPVFRVSVAIDSPSEALEYVLWIGSGLPRSKHSLNRPVDLAANAQRGNEGNRLT